LTSNSKQINDVLAAEINRFPELFDKFSVNARLHLQFVLRFLLLMDANEWMSYECSYLRVRINLVPRAGHVTRGNLIAQLRGRRQSIKLHASTSEIYTSIARSESILHNQLSESHKI
jgi:hypothetical protein